MSNLTVEEQIAQIRQFTGADRRAYFSIASIFPLPLRQVRPYFQPMPIYDLAAVPRGTPPSVVVVGNQIQLEQQPVVGGTRQVTVFAHEVANDLMDHWTRSMPAAGADDSGVVGHPGIWICKGDKPTRDEIDLATASQGVFFRRQIAMADELQANEKRRKDITKLMRIAADWMNVEGRAWQLVLTPDTLTACKWCKTSIAGDSVVCPQCSRVVNDAAYADMTARQEALLENARRRINPAFTAPPSGEEAKPIAPPILSKAGQAATAAAAAQS